MAIHSPYEIPHNYDMGLKEELSLSRTEEVLWGLGNWVEEYCCGRASVSTEL